MSNQNPPTEKEAWEYLNREDVHAFMAANGMPPNSEGILPAIDYANFVAFHIKKATVMAQGPFIEFCGQTCEDCPGWDGKPGRCECGNQRVQWLWEGDFRDMTIWGDTY